MYVSNLSPFFGAIYCKKRFCFKHYNFSVAVGAVCYLYLSRLENSGTMLSIGSLNSKTGGFTIEP